LALLNCHVSQDVANTRIKITNVLLPKNKNVIMCYNRVLERQETTEAIGILHVKIARGMKKLLILNRFCLPDMLRNMEKVRWRLCKSFYLVGGNKLLIIVKITS